MYDESAIKEIVNDAVRQATAEAFSEFESRFGASMQSRMNVMGNSFAYIAKLLEDSGLATANVDKEKLCWQTDMKNIVYELIDINRKEFPTYNSVMKTVCRKMRNVYGVSSEQLRYEYKEMYGLESLPDALDAVADDKTVRELFEAILKGLFPADWWTHKDGVSDSDFKRFKTGEEKVCEIVKPLAEKFGDTTKGYGKTLRQVYRRMDCSWSNLQTRYKNANNLKVVPKKITIVVNNPAVFRKFKKCVREMLDE